MTVNTTKWAIPKQTDADPADLQAAHNAAFNRIDAVMMGFEFGTLALRPAAGKRGRRYYATDNGKLYEDNGTTWDEVVIGTDTRLSDQRVPTDGSVTSAKIGVGAGHALGPLLRGGYLVSGANGGANSVFSIGGPLGFTMPRAGDVRVKVMAMINEEGATGPTSYVVTPQAQIDAGAWDSAYDGVAGGSVDGGRTDTLLEGWNWIKLGLGAGVHTLQLRLIVSNSPVLVVVRGKGLVEVDLI
jgi:hypothetical protein